ncbi:MAG: HAMP domain-containing sensor histidine kinase [Bacteroidota bacterium]
MNIKFKLAFWFTLFVALILCSSFYIVYQNYSVYRQNNFYERLYDRANYITKALLDTRHLDDQTIETINAYTQSVSPNLEISLYSLEGELIQTVGNPIPLNIFQENLKQPDPYFEKQLNDTQYIGFIYLDGATTLISIASSYDKTGFKKVTFLRNLFLIILGMSIFTTAIAGWWFARFSLRPMNAVVADVENITATNLHSRLSVTSPNDEVAQLAKTFNNMLDRLEGAFELQKDFVSNASHEFRTPLTSMKGQIQVALLKERSPAEYKKLLQSLNDDINNNIGLLNALQDLAKANADFPMKSFYRLPILDVLIDAQKELTKGKPHYSINISVSEPLEYQEMLYCTGDVNLLKSAFMNLMDNGCKFSPDNKVQVKVIPDSDTICLLFADEGVGIHSSDIPHIFEPFFRSNDTRNISGHGIGLSLVKRVIELHNGIVTVMSQPGTGTTFKVFIPTSFDSTGT